MKINDYIFFQGKVTEAKKVKGLTNADLAKMTGLSKKTIEAFMCKSGNKSKRTAGLIAKVLHIER